MASTSGGRQREISHKIDTDETDQELSVCIRVYLWLNFYAVFFSRPPNIVIGISNARNTT